MEAQSAVNNAVNTESKAPATDAVAANPIAKAPEAPVKTSETTALKSDEPVAITAVNDAIVPKDAVPALQVPSEPSGDATTATTNGGIEVDKPLTNEKPEAQPSSTESPASEVQAVTTNPPPPPLEVPPTNSAPSLETNNDSGSDKQKPVESAVPTPSPVVNEPATQLEPVAPTPNNETPAPPPPVVEDKAEPSTEVSQVPQHANVAIEPKATTTDEAPQQLNSTGPSLEDVSSKPVEPREAPANETKQATVTDIIKPTTDSSASQSKVAAPQEATILEAQLNHQSEVKVPTDEKPKDDVVSHTSAKVSQLGADLTTVEAKSKIEEPAAPAQPQIKTDIEAKPASQPLTKPEEPLVQDQTSAPKNEQAPMQKDEVPIEQAVSKERASQKEEPAPSSLAVPTKAAVKSVTEVAATQPVIDQKPDKETTISVDVQDGKDTLAAPQGRQKRQRRAKEEKSKPEKSEERISKRVRLQYQPFQCPEPVPPVVKTLLKPSKPETSEEEKIIVFNKGDFLAVRNEIGSFYVCRAAQNVYKSTRRFKIQWLTNEKNPDFYEIDFYDTTDIETVLTNLSMKKHDRTRYKLPKEEEVRTKNILQRALNVEKGLEQRPDPKQVAADGVDLSLVGKAEEKELLALSPKVQTPAPKTTSNDRPSEKSTSETKTPQTQKKKGRKALARHAIRARATPAAAAATPKKSPRTSSSSMSPPASTVKASSGRPTRAAASSSKNLSPSPAISSPPSSESKSSSSRPARGERQASLSSKRAPVTESVKSSDRRKTSSQNETPRSQRLRGKTLTSSSSEKESSKGTSLLSSSDSGLTPEKRSRSSHKITSSSTPVSTAEKVPVMQGQFVRRAGSGKSKVRNTPNSRAKAAASAKSPNAGPISAQSSKEPHTPSKTLVQPTLAVAHKSSPFKSLESHASETKNQSAPAPSSKEVSTPSSTPAKDTAKSESKGRRKRKASPPEPAKEEATADTPARAKRLRQQTQPFQVIEPVPSTRSINRATRASAAATAPTPTAPVTKAEAPPVTPSSSTKTEGKDIIFKKGEFLALRNETGGFYICRTNVNVIKGNRRFKILWLNNEGEKDKDVYAPDFDDETDIECVLTNVRMSKHGNGKWKIPKEEKERTMSILEKALGAERGSESVEIPSLLSDTSSPTKAPSKQEEKSSLKSESSKEKEKPSSREKKDKDVGENKSSLVSAEAHVNSSSGSSNSGSQSSKNVKSPPPTSTSVSSNSSSHTKMNSSSNAVPLPAQPALPVAPIASKSSPNKKQSQEEVNSPSKVRQSPSAKQSSSVSLNLPSAPSGGASNSSPKSLKNSQQLAHKSKKVPESPSKNHNQNHDHHQVKKSYSPAKDALSAMMQQAAAMSMSSTLGLAQQLQPPQAHMSLGMAMGIPTGPVSNMPAFPMAPTPSSVAFPQNYAQFQLNTIAHQHTSTSPHLNNHPYKSSTSEPVVVEGLHFKSK